MLSSKILKSYLVSTVLCIHSQQCDAFHIPSLSSSRFVKKLPRLNHARSSLGALNELPIQNSNQIKNEKDPLVVVVVGAGVGGLAVASRLASSPDIPSQTKIIVVEKNSPEKVGGRCGSFSNIIPEFGEFRFERGPSLLLLKQVYLDLFRDCGKDAKEFGLEIKQCAPAYQVVFDDGDAIQLGFPTNVDDAQSLEKLSRGEMDKYEPHGAKKWDEYMRTNEAFLDCGLPNFIEEKFDLKSFPSFIFEATRDGFKSWPLKPHSDVLDDTFVSNKMKALASFQNLYVGLEPYRNDDQIGGGVLKKTAPAVFGLLAAIELHPTNKKAGVFAPIGGFQKVSDAFEKLAVQCGVEIQYNKNVLNISSEGITYIDETDMAEHFVPADIIITNADLAYSKKSLFPEIAGETSKKKQPSYDWDDGYDFSSGVIAFYWCIKERCDSLNTHNVFLMSSSRSDMENSWAAIRHNNPSTSSFDSENYPFNFYVHRASAVDESAAPEGCDSLMVLVPCCTLKRDADLAGLSRDECIAGYKDQFDANFVAKVKGVVLQRLGALHGLENIESLIVDEKVETPATFADHYNLAAGTPFALSHGFSQLSLTRPSQRSSESQNLLFVGAGTRPGNGVPLVLLGAEQVSKKAVRKLQDLHQTNKQSQI